MIKIVQKWMLRVIFILILAAFSVEITAQLLCVRELGGSAYIARAVGIPEEHMHRPNIEFKTEQSSLYDWNTNPAPKHNRFRTDEYGTIHPTTLSAVIAGGEPYALFCGGSTTECAFVGEDSRVPVVFSRVSGIPAVSAAQSGKDLAGCVATLNLVLSQRDIRASYVIISSNVNTLGSFGVKMSESITLRERVRAILPATHLVLEAAAEKLSLARESEQIPEPIRHYGEYERSLWKGCCYGPGMLNRRRPRLDWLSAHSTELYADYVKRGVTELSVALDRGGVSKDEVVIFVEPNSFEYQSIASKHDYRQLLHGFDGTRLSLSESQQIISAYDAIYEAQFVAAGYRVVRVPSDYMSGDDFYDAVHLTRQGSVKVGEFLVRAVRP